MPETTTAAPKPLAAGPEAPSLTAAESYLMHIRDALGRMLLALPAVARMQQTSEHPGHLAARTAFDPEAVDAMCRDLLGAARAVETWHNRLCPLFHQFEPHHRPQDTWRYKARGV
jgi:hypothetical protein